MYKYNQLSADSQQRALQDIKLIVATKFYTSIESYAIMYLANRGLVGKGQPLEIDYDIHEDSVCVVFNGQVDVNTLQVSLKGDIDDLFVKNRKNDLEIRLSVRYNSDGTLIQDYISQSIDQLSKVLTMSYSHLIATNNILKYSGNLHFSESGSPLL